MSQKHFSVAAHLTQVAALLVCGLLPFVSTIGGMLAGNWVIVAVALAWMAVGSYAYDRVYGWAYFSRLRARNARS